MLRVFSVLSVLLLAANAQAQENIELKSGRGREIVVAFCGACHSLQYLPENGFLNRQAWEAEVTKMVKAFSAPIEPADARVIIDYLSANYGSGS